jgi:NADPH-dependent 2,4-dienoyl-CoA reductase/sulfur reductase-like enzyme
MGQVDPHLLLFRRRKSADRKAAHDWKGGRLVVNVVENPIKCPVAPLEFLMLADWYFTKRGMRDRVELVFATPLPGAFTKPVASKMLTQNCWKGAILSSSPSL